MTTYKISPDSDPQNPREDENVGTMACWHNRYRLGDEQPKEQPVDFEKKLPKNSVVIPLYLYDHSGITMATQPFSCPWDSGQVGFIYATPKKLKEEYGKDWANEENMATIRRVLESEVAVYSQYLEGDYWVLETLDEEGKSVECVAGFAGSDPFKNGMSDYVEESNYPALAEAADEAGVPCSYPPKPKTPSMR